MSSIFNEKTRNRLFVVGGITEKGLAGPKGRSQSGNLRRGLAAPPYQLQDLGEHCKFPSGVRGRVPEAYEFYCLLDAKYGFSYYISEFSLHANTMTYEVYTTV